MKKLFSLLAITSLFALSSCSNFLQVEKRHYEKGFYVHCNSKKTDQTNSASVTAQNPASVQTISPAQQNETSSSAVAPSSTDNMKFSSASGTIAQNMKRKIATVQKMMPAPLAKKLTAFTQSPIQHSAVFRASKKPAPGTGDPVVLLILAILLSPIAVYLVDGHATPRFWLDLICWLLGVGIGIGYFPFAGALWLFAVIYAIVIVLGAT